MNAIATPHLRLLVVLGIAMVASACGSGIDNRPSTLEDSPAVDQTEEAIIPASPSPAVTPTATSEADQLESAVAVETIYLEPAGEYGWPIEAGTWVSHSFTPPLSFTLPEAGTVIGDGAGRLEIVIGDPAAPEGHLVLATPVAVSSPGGPIPIDLVDAGKALSGSVVLFTGSVEHEDPELDVITVRDIMITADPRLEPFLLPCYRTADAMCIDPLVTTSGLVFLEVGVPHRITTQDYNDDRLYIVATSTNGADGDFGELAIDVATTAVAAIGSTYDGTIALKALGDRAEVVLAGTYVARVGDTAIDVSLASSIEDASLVTVSPDVIGVESANDVGWIWFINFSSFTELGSMWPVDKPDSVAEEVMATAEFEAGLRARLQVLDQGVDTVGGVDAVWFDVTADGESPGATKCSTTGWLDRSAWCVVYATTPNVFWYQASGVVDRYFYLEDADLLINVSPWPGYSIDDVLEAYAPLLEGLQIATVADS